MEFVTSDLLAFCFDVLFVSFDRHCDENYDSEVPGEGTVVIRTNLEYINFNDIKKEKKRAIQRQ